MAIRLESKNNFLVITNTISGDITNLIPQKTRFKIYSDTLHIITERYQDDLHFTLVDLVDLNNVAFEDLNAWLLLNTGNVNNTDVSIQSSTSPFLIVKASTLDAETTITTTTAKDDYIINVTSATGFVIGKYLTIYNIEANRVFFANILAINTLAITLDTPIDFEFLSGSFVNVGSTNMNVDGSITPKIFGIRNPNVQDVALSYDITRIIFKCLTSATIDLSKFGDIIGGLTRGLVARKVDGTYRNIFNVKTNAELKNLMYDFDIQLASGNQQDGFTGRFTFEKLGSVLRLEQNEDLQFIVQDDLSDLTEFNIIAQGAEVTI